MRKLVICLSAAFTLGAGEAMAQGAAFDVVIEGNKVATTVERGTVVLCPDNASPDECVELSDWCSYGVMEPGRAEAIGRFPLQEDEEKEDFVLLDTEYEKELRREFQSQGISCGSELAVVLTLLGVRAQVNESTDSSPAQAGSGAEASGN